MQTEKGSPPEEVVPVEFKFEGMTISSEEDIRRLADRINNDPEFAKQLDTSISNISSVGETNAATSEESSSLSQELNSQADSLKNLVNRFKLKNE